MLPQPPLWLILVAFICMLGPLVFFHELGHYLVARLFRIPAEIFSIGFGGEIVELPEAPGARLIVAKLASSPLPNDARICVYLNNL